MEFKSKSKQQHRATLIVLLLVASANLQKAECLSISADMDCNATSMTGCLVADIDDDEFFMESETSRRILIGGTKPQIGYGSLNPGKPFCQRNVYGSCIGMKSKNYMRPCGYENHCR